MVNTDWQFRRLWAIALFLQAAEQAIVRVTDLESKHHVAEAGPAAAGGMRAAEMPAEQASAFLKTMAHDGRLKILCHLAEGERSVTELEALVGSRQAAVSQQLARLRLEGVVSARRDGKAVYYRMADKRTLRLVALLHELFCEGEVVNQSATGNGPS